MKVTFVNVTNATPRSRKRSREGVSIFTRLGYETAYGDLLGYRKGEFRYPAKQRAKVFNAALKSADVIGCTNGGFFAYEMLEGIDYQLLKKNKPIIFGFSDITHLLYASWSKGRTKGIYISPHLLNSPIAKRTFTNLNKGKLIRLDYSKKFTFIKHGKSDGMLIPGADICLYNMYNSDYSFSNRGKVIFLESHYHSSIHDFLYWMIIAKSQGFFEGITGLLIGSQHFINKKRFNSSEVLIREVLQIFKNDNFPIAVTKKLSAQCDFIMPFGGNCKMDSKSKNIKITY